MEILRDKNKEPIALFNTVRYKVIEFNLDQAKQEIEEKEKWQYAQVVGRNSIVGSITVREENEEGIYREFLSEEVEVWEGMSRPLIYLVK